MRRLLTKQKPSRSGASFKLTAGVVLLTASYLQERLRLGPVFEKCLWLVIFHNALYVLLRSHYLCGGYGFAAVKGIPDNF